MSVPAPLEPPRGPKSMMQPTHSSQGSNSNTTSTTSNRQRGESAERSVSATRGPQVTSEKGKSSLAKVPCKFFRAGACSNEACPFLHQEQGTPKQICPWYQTQSCKFGAKCALAHVLPGQPMSMDRKNKRAQQLAQREAEAGHANPNGSSSANSPPATPSKPSSPSKSAPSSNNNSTNNNSVSLTKRQSGFMPSPSQPAATVQSQPILAGPTSPSGPSSSSSPATKSVWGPNLNPAIKAPPPSSSTLSNGPSRQVGFAPPSEATSTTTFASAAAAGTSPSSASYSERSGPTGSSAVYQGRPSNITAAATGGSPSVSQSPPQNQTFGQSPRGIILGFLNSSSGEAITGTSARPELHGGAAEYTPQQQHIYKPAAAAESTSSAWPTSSAAATGSSYHLTSPLTRGLEMPQSLPANGTHAFGTSPFSNPGSRSIFLQPSSFGSDDNHLESVFEGKQPAQHLKRPDPWGWGGPRQAKPASFAGFHASLATGTGIEIDEEDEDDEDRAEEDFLPSSLHDLLTPDELQRAHRAQQKSNQQRQPQQHLFDLDGGSRSFPDHEALLQQQAPLSKQRWAQTHESAYSRDEATQHSNGASPARRMTLLSHAPGTSLPPAITSGMSRMQLHPTSTAYATIAAENTTLSTSPWAAAPMTRESPIRPSAASAAAAGRQRRTSHGSTANNPGLFVGSPLAQAWTHPNEDDEFVPSSLLQRSAIGNGKLSAVAAPVQAPQTTSTPGLADDDEEEGLPFSMD